MQHECVENRIQDIVTRWFVTEPALFSVFYSHGLVPNIRIQVPMRSGQGRIEYNAELLSQMDDRMLEAYLRVELVRIILKHPYERQPLGCRADALRGGSDLVISQFYSTISLKMLFIYSTPYPKNKSFEWYVRVLNAEMQQSASKQQQNLNSSAKNNKTDDATEGLESGQNGEGNDDNSSKNQDDGQGDNQDDNKSGNQSCDDKEGISANIDDNFSDSQASDGADANQHTDSDPSNAQGSKSEDSYGFGSVDYTELWEEDAEKQTDINELVLEGIKKWGTLPSNLVETIKTAAQGRIDYRRVLSGFRASIISSKRHLTRMKPSRRSGFQYMGSTFELSTRLLVAIDVSGSVASTTIAKFLAVIERFFKYGVSEIKVIQFDTVVKEEVYTLKESSKHFRHGYTVTGRGGTSFVSVFRYLQGHNDYDGLVILTDGDAPTPQVNFFTRTKIIWVFDNENDYNRHHTRLETLGRTCFMTM